MKWMYTALVGLSLLVICVNAVPTVSSKEVNQKEAVADIADRKLDEMDVTMRGKKYYGYPYGGYGGYYPYGGYGYPYGYSRGRRGYPYGYYYPGPGYRYGVPYGYKYGGYSS